MRASASLNAVQPSALAPPPGTMMWLRPFGLIRHALTPSASSDIARFTRDLYEVHAQDAILEHYPACLGACQGPFTACPPLLTLSQHIRTWGVKCTMPRRSDTARPMCAPTLPHSLRCADSGPKGWSRWTRRRSCCPRGTPWLSQACHSTMDAHSELLAGLGAKIWCGHTACAMQMPAICSGLQATSSSCCCPKHNCAGTGIVQQGPQAACGTGQVEELQSRSTHAASVVA